MGFDPGQQVGDYEVVAQLGAGGLGAVYEVRHSISQRREAMKVLLPEQSGTPDMVERFRREVQTLAALSHINIAQLHTAFYYQNQLVMIMELVDGETMRDRRLRSSITLAESVGIIGQVLEALVYAHAAGVVHRDLKPSNIMLTRSGLVKLLDFGIAITGQGSELTRAGYLLGSINYISPEQIGGAKASPCSDIYSVGVTLYELITGTLPITGASNYEIMQAHIQRVPVAPHIVAPGIPLALSVATMRALEKDPARRFANAREFLSALHPDPAVNGTTVLPALTQPVPTAGSLPTSGSLAGLRRASSSGMQNLALEELTRNLAFYIGPVAKFVVKKLAAQTDDIDLIFREAAKQISTDADRAAFLKSKARIFSKGVGLQ